MLDKNSAVSLQQQLTNVIREKLDSGEWKLNQKIPSENELAAEYGISRMTVRGVITSMVKEGFFYRVQGKGTFVSDSRFAITAKGVHSFRQQLEDKGHTYRTEILDCKKIAQTGYLQEILDASSLDKEILFIYAITYIQSEVICIHKAFVSASLDQVITKQSLKDTSLLELMELAGFRTADITENIKCVYPGDEDAKNLQVSKWHPVLLVSDIHRNQEGKAFLLYEYAFRGERVSINLRLQDMRTFSFEKDPDSQGHKMY